MKTVHGRRRFACKAAALTLAVALPVSLAGTAAPESAPPVQRAPMALEEGVIQDFGGELLPMPDDAPSVLEKVAEKGSLSLYASLVNGEFAVRDSKTGTVWYSNPPDRWDDPYSGSDRPATLSLMTAHYVDMTTRVDEYPTSYGACEIENGISVKRIPDGIEVSFTFVEAQITIPLCIELTDHGVKASVDVTRIEEKGSKTLMDISLLPYFGAGGVEDDGYIVVPDGCGALIDFNNGKQNFVRFQEPIYGLNTILSGEQRTKISENCPLPLFGIRNGDSGYAAIITDGDAVASVTAGVSKKGSGYNNVFVGYTLRSASNVVLNGATIPIYEKGKPHLDTCAVEYRLLTGEDATYTGIAKAYSAYLQQELGVKPLDRNGLSMFVEVYGAVRIDRSVLGIPTKVTQTLTTFEQARELTAALQKAGVEHLILDYQNYDASALRGKMPVSFKPDNKLGGKGGYERLKTWLDTQGIPLVSNVNFTTYAVSGGGVSVRGDSAKSFAGLPGLRYSFNLATQQADTSAPAYYYLAPRELPSVIGRFQKSYDAARFGAIGLDTLATMLYADFSEQGSGRQATRNTFAQAADTLAQNSDVYLRGGASHLFPSASYIFDMPDDDSQYDIVDRSIPLLQLAVSGLIPYSITPINGNADPDKQLLKAVEYGADLKFNFTYSDPGITGDPTLGYLNGVWYEPWLDYAAEAYQKAAALREQVGDSLEGHAMVQEGVYVTTYTGGSRVAVNYTDSDVNVEGTVVPAMDFALLGGGARHE